MFFKKFSYKKINSTNDTAIKKIKQNIKAGIIVTIDQKKGRGQHGRKWISQRGNLLASVFFQINKKISLKKVTKINCLILKNLLMELIKRKITIKLPNDLLLNKKKICGILQETIFYDGNKYIIIGIGINLVKNPIIKKYQITNILKETGIKIQILKLVKLIEKKYINKIKQFA